MHVLNSVKKTWIRVMQLTSHSTNIMVKIMYRMKNKVTCLFNKLDWKSSYNWRQDAKKIFGLKYCKQDNVMVRAMCRMKREMIYLCSEQEWKSFYNWTQGCDWKYLVWSDARWIMLWLEPCGGWIQERWHINLVNVNGNQGTNKDKDGTVQKRYLVYRDTSWMEWCADRGGYNLVSTNGSQVTPKERAVVMKERYFVWSDTSLIKCYNEVS